MQILAAISRMPHLCIFTSKGDYQAIIASEHSSIIVPGVAHPIHRTNSFASSLGSGHYPQLEEAITSGDLVFCKSPIYAKSFLGMRKKYIGSKVKKQSDKRIV